jgi:hypothetical protein
MAKIKLGARPKTFKHTIKVALPEGGDGEVQMVYRYRTRTEFGAFLDELFADAKVSAKSQMEEDVVQSLKTALATTRDTNADYILKIAEGWNLTDDDGDPLEFNRANVAQMCDELPGVAMEIINVYRMAVSEGRLGN